MTFSGATVWSKFRCVIGLVAVANKAACMYGIFSVVGDELTQMSLTRELTHSL